MLIATRQLGRFHTGVAPSACAVSTVNVTTCVTCAMNMFETIAWIALGFGSTIAAMEAA